MQTIDFRKISILLAIILVSGAFFSFPVCAGKDLSVPESYCKSESSCCNYTVNDTGTSVFVVRNISDPISTGCLNDMRESVINSYQQMTKQHCSFVLADPEVPDGAEIVAFGFAVDENGIPVQYVGLAGDEESVAIIHRKAEEWKKSVYAYADKFSAGRTETVKSSGWVEFGRSTGDYYLSPYGGVTNNYEIRKLSNDGDASKDWFAVKQIFAMEPGVSAYSSSYTNHMGMMLHDWAAGVSNSPELYEWDPLGTITGTRDISISITGGTGGASATWSWGYTQPDVTTYDQSSTNTEKAKWSIYFNSDASKQTTGGMKPGSTCSVTQHNSGTYRILDLQADGKYYSGFILYHTLSHVWHINYQY